MKYFLFTLLITCGLVSCIPIFFHKKFTYRSDGRSTGIDKHLKINGRFISEYIASTTNTGNFRSSVNEIFLYADGSIFVRNHLNLFSLKHVEKYLRLSGKPDRDYGAYWGQCMVVGDSLFAQMMFYRGAHQFGIYVDTFIIRSDTSFESLISNGYGKRLIYHLQPTEAKLDSTIAGIKSLNWYWTNDYQDSLYRRGKYKSTN